MLTDINPKLPMRDKIATKEFYIDKLKFSENSDYGDYLLLKKDNIEIHFFEFKDLDQKKIMDKFISEQMTLINSTKSFWRTKLQFTQMDI